MFFSKSFRSAFAYCTSAVMYSFVFYCHCVCYNITGAVIHCIMLPIWNYRIYKCKWSIFFTCHLTNSNTIKKRRWSIVIKAVSKLLCAKLSLSIVRIIWCATCVRWSIWCCCGIITISIIVSIICFPHCCSNTHIVIM